MTSKPIEEKQTPQELKAKWLRLNDTMEKVTESREALRVQILVVKEKIREYRGMLERLKAHEVEDPWFVGLKKLTNEAWDAYQASTEGEAESGK